MTATKQRMDWVDLIKGTSVVLVVLMHVALTLTAVVGDTFASGFWGLTGTLLEPLRMPVFFTVSGMLAAGAVHRPWDHTRRRTLGILYLYVLWTVILVAGFALFFPAEGPIVSLLNLPATLIFVASGYWYLFALVLFFAIARITRNVNPWLVVGLAAMPNLFRPLTHTAIETLAEPLPVGTLAPSMAMNMVFFLAGVRFKEIFAGITRFATWPRVAALGGLLLALGVFRHLTPALWPQTFLPLSALWIVWAIMIGHLATSRFESPRAFGAYMGVRTLPIFVIQFPILHFVRVGLERTDPAFMSNPGIQFIYPIAITAFIVFFALVVHEAAQGTVARYAFTAPDWALGLRSEDARVPSPRARARSRSAVPATA